MNNPHNLSPVERGIQQGKDFNRGINMNMSRETRLRKKIKWMENSKLRANLHAEKAAGRGRAEVQLRIDAISMNT